MRVYSGAGQFFAISIQIGEVPEKYVARQRAEKSGGHLITRVCDVVVLYRPKSGEEKQPV